MSLRLRPGSRGCGFPSITTGPGSAAIGRPALRALNRVVALEAYEPVGEGEYRHRSAQLDLGRVQAVATAQTDIAIQGRLCRPGRAFLRLPLAGSIAMRQGQRRFILAPGRASFDWDDSSGYEARITGSALLVLSLDPQRIAAAAALLRGPQDDPSPWPKRTRS